MDRDTQIRVIDEDDEFEVWSGSLGDFLDDNEFDRQEVSDIYARLDDGRDYQFGGGAAPAFRIEVL